MEQDVILKQEIVRKNKIDIMLLILCYYYYVIIITLLSINNYQLCQLSIVVM